MTVFEMYKRHLADYDLETVQEISGAPSHLVERLATDIWETTQAGKPVAIHIGEGINHYFHATLHNRACYLPLMLTGNIGKHGAGSHTWAGNYKGALFQASAWSGPGVGAYTYEDPFRPVLDESAKISHDHLRHLSDGEDPSYWACGERTLTVALPNGETRCFTGKTHLPTPTKVIWYNNANFLNQSKWIYNLIVNVLPRVDMIVDQQIEWTGSAEYADVVLPVNSWVEMEDWECGASCSNPFLQVWKGGIRPVHDTIDDAAVFAGVARAMAEITADQRFADHFKFVTEKKSKVYLQRVFDSSTTTRGKDGPYDVDKLIAGEYGGEPGAALMLFRTYPRVPFWEQIHDSIPFYTDCGRLSSYCDLPEAIEFGENLIVHREAVEATPYLPNVIVSTSPYVRPRDWEIPLDTIDADLRQVRNVKLPGKRSSSRSTRSGNRATASSVRLPRAAIRPTPRGRRSIGTGSGATTSATHTAPTSVLRELRIARSNSTRKQHGSSASMRAITSGWTPTVSTARTSAGRRTPGPGTRRFAAWCGSSSIPACLSTSPS